MGGGLQGVDDRLNRSGLAPQLTGPVTLTAQTHNRTWQAEMSRHSKVYYF